MNLPKSPTFLGNFCKGVKIYHICSEIIFGYTGSHWSQMLKVPPPTQQHMGLDQVVNYITF